MPRNKILSGLLCSLFLLALPLQAEEITTTEINTIKVLDLPTAQRIALVANPSLSAALARVEQAKARVEQAAAAWWPSLDVTGSANRQRLSDSAYNANQALAALLNQSSERTSDNFSSGVQASWLLFDGFARRFQGEIAQLDEQAFSAAQRDGQRLLLLAVSEAFANAQLKQTFVSIYKADALFYAQQLEDAQHRYDAGAGTWGDILNIRVQQNAAKSSLLLAEREYEAAGYGLAALLGIDSASLPPQLQLEELNPALILSQDAKEPEELIQMAYSNRPDLRELELRSKQAHAGVGLANASFYPQIQAGAAVNGARQGDLTVSGDDFGNMIGLNMTWNLFSGGQDRARIFEADQKVREIDYQLATLRQSIAKEVRQYIALLDAAREQVVLQRDSVKLVEENRDLAKIEFDAGESPLVRLNEAQRDLNTTYSRLAQALVSYQQSKQMLLSATGQNLLDLPRQE